LVHPKTRTFYAELKDALRRKGYSSNLIVFSTKRFSWHNWLIGGEPKSKHMSGEAMDFMVLDINNDGLADRKDVDLVYQILDKEIIKNQGGLGTYKHSKTFLYQQMIHIDCRGNRGRWTR
jgi:uncharacterized protein YcbK (DUF882 family)